MTRGNQREIDRKRAESRKQKGPKDGLGDANKRKERDAAIMQEKQKAAEMKKAGVPAPAAPEAAKVK